MATPSRLDEIFQFRNEDKKKKKHIFFFVEIFVTNLKRTTRYTVQ